jgi:hypothetical protein
VVWEAVVDAIMIRAQIWGQENELQVTRSRKEEMIKSLCHDSRRVQRESSAACGGCL